MTKSELAATKRFDATLKMLDDPREEVRITATENLGTHGAAVSAEKKTIGIAALNNCLGRPDASVEWKKRIWETLEKLGGCSPAEKTAALAALQPEPLQQSSNTGTVVYSEEDVHTRLERKPPSPTELAKQLLAGLPSDDKEQRLIDFGKQSDEFREAIREELEKAIREYIHGRNPKTKEGRQRSVDLINGLLGRFGFALEHPKHSGVQCDLTLIVDSSNSQGQFRLLPRGDRISPLDRGANLSDFGYVRIIEAMPQIQPTVAESVPESSTESWSNLVSTPKTGKGTTKRPK
jgi:DNA uptake protein ComE-like DNA-binding protein